MRVTPDLPRSPSECIACGAPAGAVVLRGDTARSEGLTLLRCSRCSHVYLDGWSTGFEKELYSYYAAQLGASRAEVYDAVNTQRQRELLGRLGARTSGRRLLDVGCGHGHLVDTAAHAGWDALGIDLADEAIALARSLGARCEVRDFFAEALDEERFDVVTMNELIEHVPAPARFFRRAHTLLRAGGLLYVTTPNFASLARRVSGGAWHPLHREHLSYFTPRVLAALAERDAGLELVHAESRNFDPRAASHLARRMKARLRRRRHDGGHPGSPSVADDAAPPTRALRVTIQRSAALRAAKAVINAGLSAFDFGDTMFMTFRRPAS